MTRRFDVPLLVLFAAVAVMGGLLAVFAESWGEYALGFFCVLAGGGLLMVALLRGGRADG